jgi:hypothetical protein
LKHQKTGGEIMAKKIFLLVIIGALGIFLLSSCFTVETKPIVSGYVQYFDGSNFSTDNISVELMKLDDSIGVVASSTVITNSKGLYAFSENESLKNGDFYSLNFKKGTKETGFELASYPYFSAMTTIFKTAGNNLTIKATHTDSSKGCPGFEVKRKSDGKLLFSRLFQWKWPNGIYDDYVNLPDGTYEVSLCYLNSKDKKPVKTVIVTFDTTNSSTTITFDLSK